MVKKRDFEPKITTKSYICLLPMLELESIHLNKAYLLNVYLGSDDKPDLFPEFLFLQYELTNDISFIRTESYLKQHRYYVESYEPDNFTTILIFRIPEKWLQDYYTFLDSRYSRMSEKYKKMIYSFHKLRMGDNVVRVLKRDEKLREELEKDLDTTISKESELASSLDFSIEKYTEAHKIKNPNELKNHWKKFTLEPSAP